MKYEIERVHETADGLTGKTDVSRCDSPACTLSHFYGVYTRATTEPNASTWLADFDTLEEAQEAVDNEQFHCCDDECRSNGCTERFK